MQLRTSKGFASLTRLSPRLNNWAMAVALPALLCLSPITVAAGDPAAGRGKTAVCAACHNRDGNSLSSAFPKLAGQNERYLIKQMEDIKNGVRPVPTMAGQLDNLSEQDIADIAAYYAAQAPTSSHAEADKVTLGASIYRGGIRATGVAACAACHGPAGQGNGPAGFPRLAGQHAEYIADQLRRFRAGAEYSLAENPKARVNDGDARMMRDTALRLTDKQIDSVASFIAGLYSEQ